MRSRNLLGAILLLSLNALLSLATADREERDWHGRYNGGHGYGGHGGHRRHRSATVVGNGIRVNHKSGNGAAISSSSTSTITTTSSASDEREPEIIGAYEIEIPVDAFYHPTATKVETFHAAGGVSELTAVDAAAAVASAEPVIPFVRPEGLLPIPPDRFGFETLPPPRADAVPNCGCVQRGSCIGAVGAYTAAVLKYSDVVCGLQFQTCCFDGPWSGTIDEFASVAPCVPKEQCLRPYGVLPTDVRDFGTIPPCPGHGAVRCIAVDSAGLLEFRAALAAIEAASFTSYQQGYQINPIHIVLPLMRNDAAGRTSVETETTSTVDLSGEKLETELMRPATATCARCEPIIIQFPTPIQAVTETRPAPPAPVIVPAPVATVTETRPAPPAPVIVPAPVATVTETRPAPIPVPVPAPAVVPPPPTTATVMTHTTTTIDHPPEVLVPTTPAKVVVTTASSPPAPVPVPATTTTIARTPPSYYGRGYLPYGGGGFYGYPGLGYGGGFGFRKHLSISKGFGYGLYGK